MAITRDSRHKRRNTGGRRNVHVKKRKYETGRPAAMTKLGAKRIHLVRARGGNLKHRALRLETGNFAWGSEALTKKTRILDVVYNASNNELVRTKTLVKGAIVQIDPTPFKAWFEQHYRVAIGTKNESEITVQDVPEARADKVKARRKVLELDPKMRDLLVNNRLLARITSRPGQSGRADGQILEGEELDFYLKALNKKKGKKSA